jgi:molecular chaperone GrpE (heat shock protein)
VNAVASNGDDAVRELTERGLAHTLAGALWGPAEGNRDQTPATASLEAAFDGLAQQVEELVRLEQLHAGHVSHLLRQSELRSAELVRRGTDPVILGLVAVLDRLQDVADATADAVSAELVGVLATAGVTSVRPSYGEPVHATLHRVLSYVGTTDAGLDGTVATCRAPGWRYADGHLLRPAHVAVHRFEPSGGAA